MAGKGSLQDGLSTGVAHKATTSTSAAVTPVPVDPEDLWTAAELAPVRTGLQAQADALRVEIEEAESVSAALQRSTMGEGSGDDADAGSKTFEREHQMSIANNSRDLLTQVDRALGRIDAGTYGLCEVCSNPIAKARLQAFPRATLCVKDKKREERR